MLFVSCSKMLHWPSSNSPISSLFPSGLGDHRQLKIQDCFLPLSLPPQVPSCFLVFIQVFIHLSRLCHWLCDLGQLICLFPCLWYGKDSYPTAWCFENTWYVTSHFIKTQDLFSSSNPPLLLSPCFLCCCFLISPFLFSLGNSDLGGLAFRNLPPIYSIQNWTYFYFLADSHRQHYWRFIGAKENSVILILSLFTFFNTLFAVNCSGFNLDFFKRVH